MKRLAIWVVALSLLCASAVLAQLRVFDTNGNLIGTVSGDLHLSSPAPTPGPPPTAVPTQQPTAVPSAPPTAPPTAMPTPPPTAIPTAAPTAPPTAVPTAAPTTVANCPAAPTLVNPQTIKPGASFGGHVVAGDSVTEDTLAFGAALNVGDLYIVGGHTYAVGATSALTVNSGRNIVCQDRTAILKFIPASSTSGLRGLMTVWGNNNIYHCTFTSAYAGMHNQVPAPGYGGCASSTCPSGGTRSSSPPWTANMFIVGWSAPNVTIVDVDMDGIAGFNGAIELGTTTGTCSHNWRVCGSTFWTAGLTGIEISCGYSNLFDWNTFNNASGDEEAWPQNQAQVNNQLQHNTWDHNTFNWMFGVAQNNNGWCGIESNRFMGDMVHLCSGCTTSGATSMSTNVLSNNTINSPSGTVGGVAGCTNYPCGKLCGILSENIMGRATLINNTVNGVCGICNQ